MKYLSMFVCLFLSLMIFVVPSVAATPDGFTPSQETVCEDAGLTGALWGLCNAYCQAMDCDSDSPKASLEACRKTAQKYAEKSSGAVLPCEDVLIADLDADGVPDNTDNCPLQSNVEQADRDEDMVGDVCDNCAEFFNPNQEDIDNNGVGDACESGACTADTDGDGVSNIDDNCPDASNIDQVNNDMDSYGDACDNCLFIANDQSDADGNGVGDACEADTDYDNDGVEDNIDNCPLVANEDQANSDSDKFGDVCDNCPYITNENQVDSDNDTIGNECDNCPQISNREQYNSDGDLFGDACDNCVEFKNDQQLDYNGNLIGDACEQCDFSTDTDSDGVPDINDTNPTDPHQCGDRDNDACDDCSSGVQNPLDDGSDFDGDGLCDFGDPDDDNDYYEEQVDCNDKDPTINPGSAEFCSVGVGACASFGIITCDPTEPDNYTCNAVAGLPQIEFCDGVDNDCDGDIDNNLLAPLCNSQLGVCSGSTKSCAGTIGWKNCTISDYLTNNNEYQPDESLCDGLDNDCDGQVDENCL